MSYTALYRKFRPQRFEDVKGQEHIVTTLRNQIKSDKIQHAYLFCGTRGTGKTSVAKLFARAINCENPNGEDPCMECPSCRAIMSGTSMNVVEIDAASNNGVDNIRQIVEEVAYPPTEGKYKVYIIDEVHMLSIGAFNALLKTLEEPPSYVVFILATTDVQKLPITILSRCQRYDFRHISINDIVLRIHELLPVENIEADEDALRYIAKAADGSMRDALSLLDQCIAFNFGQKLTYDMVLNTLGAVDQTVFSEMLRVVLHGDVAGCVNMLEQLIMEGRELSQFVADFTWYLRNVLLAKTSDDISAVVDMSSDNIQRLCEEAKLITADALMRYIRILADLDNKIKYSTDKRVLCEIALIKMCKPMMETDSDTLLARIREIEKRLESDVVIKPAFAEQPILREEEPEGPSAPLPKSVPDDIKKVAEKWDLVATKLGYPAKTYLKRAIPSLSEGGALMIVFRLPIDRDYFVKYELNMQALQNVINEVAQSEVIIRTEIAREGERSDSVFPDLQKMFGNIEIEVEDE